MTRAPKKKLDKGAVVDVEFEGPPLRLGIVIDVQLVGEEHMYEVLVGLDKRWCRHHPSPGRDDILVFDPAAGHLAKVVNVLRDQLTS